MPCGVPRIPEPREWILTKHCTRCGETKPWANFAPRKYWPDGSVRLVASSCHVCERKRTARAISPQRRESVLEYKRNWNERQRAALRSERVPKGDVLLDPAPFARWIERASLDVGGQGVLAELCGVPARSLYRVLVGENERVSLSLVDKCLTAFGDHVNDIYDFESEAAA